MQVSAIQNHQLTNSSKELQVKNASFSTGISKDLTTDSFSKQKVNKNISFGSETGMVGGAILGTIAAIAIVATGGLATPVVVAALAADVACIAVGSSLDNNDKE